VASLDRSTCVMDLTQSKNAREERAFMMRLHYQRLIKARPTINTRDPAHVDRINKFKKCKANGGQHRKKVKMLQEANGKLVKHITEIACRPNKTVAASRKLQTYMIHRKKLADFTRKQKQMKLDRENELIAKRLLGRSSVYDKGKWKKDWDRFTHIRRHLSKAEFYKRTEGNSSQPTLPKQLSPLSSWVKQDHRTKLQKKKPIVARSPNNRRGKSAPSLQPLSGLKAIDEKAQETRPGVAAEQKRKTGCSQPSRGKKRPSSRAPRICVIGPPADGRDVMCANIRDDHNVPLISVRDLMEKEIQKGTKAGHKAQKCLKTRKLLSDKYTCDIVVEALQKQGHGGFVLNGYPRTMRQAQALKAAGIELDLLVILDVPQDKINDRVVGRRFDPETQTIYHTEFYPPKQKKVKKRLVIRPQDTAEALQVEKSYRAAAVEAAEKGPFATHVTHVDANASREETYDRVTCAIDHARQLKCTSHPSSDPKENPLAQFAAKAVAATGATATAVSRTPVVEAESTAGASEPKPASTARIDKKNRTDEIQATSETKKENSKEKTASTATKQYDKLSKETKTSEEAEAGNDGDFEYSEFDLSETKDEKDKEKADQDPQVVESSLIEAGGNDKEEDALPNEEQNTFTMVSGKLH